MRVLVQRTSCASCVIGQQIVGKIKEGFVLLVGFTDGDSKESVQAMIKKILNLRIFPDEEGIMNQSILEVNGEILSISQFTLYADTTKGNRPSYIKAMPSFKASLLYEYFNQCLSEKIHVETGVFGSAMEINLTNVGPTTILLER